MLVRVTLREIAAAAGVHYSTVSLALRDHPRISAPIRNRIKKLADKMGYAPDPALSALNAYRKTKLQAHYQSTIAWIDNWRGPIKLRSVETFNEYFQGASERARQLGYELEEFRLEDMVGVSPERVSKILQSRGIKGLLLAPQQSSGMKLPFNYDWFSSIAFGYSLKPHAFHLVTNHHSHSIALALQEVESLGYQRIGLFLQKYVDDKVDNSCTTGFWHHFNNNPGKTHLKPCVVKDEEDARGAFMKWFRKTSPDVVVSTGGLSIIEWLKELGLRVPRDVGHVRLSVAKDEKFLSGVYENGLLIGRTAVEFLVGMLQRGECGLPETPIRILVEGAWRPGKTIRRQKTPG
jgi:LacI family transcriptional regulator